MTVRDLVLALADHDPDAVVLVRSPVSGDSWNECGIREGHAIEFGGAYADSLRIQAGTGAPALFLDPNPKGMEW